MTRYLFTLILAFSSASFAKMEMYQVGNVQFECKALNGVTIVGDDRESNVATATLMGVSKNFHFNLNPGFFTWTWISLAQGNQLAGQGYQIFLLGNAPEGQEATLNGMMGKMVNAPTPSGMIYPLGFIPQSPISCKVYWEDLLN